MFMIYDFYFCKKLQLLLKKTRDLINTYNIRDI